MAVVANKGMTLEEFLNLEDPPDGSQLELFNGEVITLPPPKSIHGIVCNRVGRVLGNFVDEKKLGWVTSNDSGVIIEGDRDSMRGVDVGFWSIAANPKKPPDYFDNPPDLAVEVLSPNYRRKMIRDKVKQYIQAGVPIVWLVDPESEVVTVFKGGMQGVEFEGDDILDGGEVLPGFSCKTHDLFD